LLTPKGMIIATYWVWRDAAGFTLATSTTAAEATRHHFGRLLPPRLARLSERTGEKLLWCVGDGVDGMMPTIGVPWPDPGRVTAVGEDSATVLLGRPLNAIPCAGIAVGPPGAVEALFDRLGKAGAESGTEDQLTATRILAGWPELGREIDDRTLPQEVRLDDLGGVSFSKGCYVGQETVARIHFRGHPNRLLRGLRWKTVATLPGPQILSGEHRVGVITSVLEAGPISLGLAVLRREVQPEAEVTIGGSLPAKVFALPFPGGVLPG
jgi:folate-binding protein YgfZ